MYLIRQLAAKYKLTRTSLLHYDAIGLLSPSGRTEAGYRLYSEDDEKKLQSIVIFRSMGISLDNIRLLLDYNKSTLANALLIRLNELNQEIEELKQRQKNIINLLKEVKTFDQVLSGKNQDQIAQILFNGIKPLEWHERFEAISPDLHQEFLKIADSIPESIKESIQTYLHSLPEDELNRLNRIISRK